MNPHDITPTSPCPSCGSYVMHSLECPMTDTPAGPATAALRERVIREITIAPGWNKADATALVDELLAAAQPPHVLVEDPPEGTDDSPATANGRDMLAHAVQYDPADADRRVVAAKLIAIEREAAETALRPLREAAEAFLNFMDAESEHEDVLRVLLREPAAKNLRRLLGESSE